MINNYIDKVPPNRPADAPPLLILHQAVRNFGLMAALLTPLLGSLLIGVCLFDEKNRIYGLFFAVCGTPFFLVALIILWRDLVPGRPRRLGLLVGFLPYLLALLCMASAPVVSDFRTPDLSQYKDDQP